MGIENPNKQSTEKATIKLEDLNYEILEKIVGAYDRIVGGRGSPYLNPDLLEKIMASLKMRRPVEYRYGSRISMHSKLWIRCVPFSEEIVFEFDPNIPTGNPKNDQLSKELELKFNKFEINKIGLEPHPPTGSK